MVNTADFYKYAERFKDTVYRVALNYCGNSCDAEDALQEVLIKLYTTGTRFNDEEHVKHWLIRVTLNLCNNMMRNRGRRESLDETVAVQAENFDRQEQIELFSSVMSLPEKYRTVLYLFYYEDYSVKEIAEILHIKSSAVTTRLSRARNILKIQLTEGDTYEL